MVSSSGNRLPGADESAFQIDNTSAGYYKSPYYATHKNKVQPVPSPRTDPPRMQLADIVNDSFIEAIQNANKIVFHAVGDTGAAKGFNPTTEAAVADLMAADVQSGGVDSPSFFFHLGDVVYYFGEGEYYYDQFYEPFRAYDRPIFAIPGNHDGETFAGTDPKPLQAFLDNFCQTKAGVPKDASDVGIFREMVPQPGVYWLLKAPFVNVIGLYSNIAEGPGDLRGASNDTKQIKWLQTTLAALKAAGGDKQALVIATHHPVFSEGGHSGSDFLLSQIDQACTAAGIVPHALLAGHTHTYQRYTRTITRPINAQMICIDAGCGGHAKSAVKAANGQHVGDAVYVKSLQGYGYVLATASKDQLVLEMFRTDTGHKTPFDKATINIATRRVT